MGSRKRTLIPEADSTTLRVGRRNVRLTNLDKVFWPELGLEKRDLLQYYADVSDALLPHLRDRTLPPRHQVSTVAPRQGATPMHHGADPMTAKDKLTEYRRKRDFRKTAEPRGSRPKRAKKLAFVIQKHAASHLHYDLRLELDGVMKSWAVPKGPSLDPAVKRLAMEVEDHPIEYNKFEGTIPKGEYGGGTVMLWDRGTYRYGGDDPDPTEGLRRGYAKGDFKFILEGKRLKGSWVLVRTRRGEAKRPQWLLIKHRDGVAEPGSEVVAEHTTSVATGRTMEEIAEGKRGRSGRKD